MFVKTKQTNKKKNRILLTFLRLEANCLLYALEDSLSIFWLGSVAEQSIEPYLPGRKH